MNQKLWSDARAMPWANGPFRPLEGCNGWHAVRISDGHGLAVSLCATQGWDLCGRDVCRERAGG
jgi:hypothetical protein